jgi:hypothetical protein
MPCPLRGRGAFGDTELADATRREGVARFSLAERACSPVRLEMTRGECRGLSRHLRARIRKVGRGEHLVVPRR